MPDDGSQDEAARNARTEQRGASDLASLFAHREAEGSDPAAVQLEDIHAMFENQPTEAIRTAGMPTAGAASISAETGAGSSAGITRAELNKARLNRAIEHSVGDGSMHLFSESGAIEPDPAAGAHPTGPLPRSLPARHEPEHAAPGYGITRPQLIAMGVGAVITLIGIGWTMMTPAVPVPVPVAVKPSPTVTVDPARVAKVNDSIDALAGGVQAAQASAGSFEAPLAGIAGYSDDAARIAADTARQAFAAATAAVKVPEKVGATSDTATLDQRERDVATAQTALTAATTAFHNAIGTFRQSILAYAATAVETNADADESFRTAATDAAAALANSDPFGPPAFAPWDAWRTALANLVADEARVIDEQNSYSGGSGTSSGGTDTSTPQDAAPSAPANPPAATP